MEMQAAQSGPILFELCVSSQLTHTHTHSHLHTAIMQNATTGLRRKIVIKTNSVVVLKVSISIHVLFTTDDAAAASMRQKDESRAKRVGTTPNEKGERNRDGG